MVGFTSNGPAHSPWVHTHHPGGIHYPWVESPSAVACHTAGHCHTDRAAVGSHAGKGRRSCDEGNHPLGVEAAIGTPDPDRHNIRVAAGDARDSSHGSYRGTGRGGGYSREVGPVDRSRL